MYHAALPTQQVCSLSASAAATAGSAATMPTATAGRGRTSRWTRGLSRRGFRRSDVPMSTTSAMIGTAGARRIAMMSRPRMMPARRRRRRRRRTPRVHDDRVLHDNGLLGRLDARPVAMRADGRPVGMRDDLHAVADRTERPVNVTSVNPRAGRHTAGHKGNRSSRQNRREVLVHDPPPFPFYTRQGGSTQRI